MNNDSEDTPRLTPGHRSAVREIIVVVIGVLAAVHIHSWSADWVSGFWRWALTLVGWFAVTWGLLGWIHPGCSHFDPDGNPVYPDETTRDGEPGDPLD